ncbi:MAG: hypothetical protein V2A73_09920 [Pseudomonadota bacterium]
MNCQCIQSKATEPLSSADKIVLRLFKRGGRTLSLLGKAIGDPLGAARRLTAARRKSAVTPATTSDRCPRGRLELEPGERVRVKKIAEIRATLNGRGQYHGLAYMPEMERYSGKTMTVRKRVTLFFDERTREMRKLKDVVILEDVFCEGRPSDPWDYGGCDRTCFLFWKEAWLERVAEKLR